MEPVIDVSEEPHHHLVLENGCVRVFRVEVAAGEETLLHHHARDYAFVHLGDSETTDITPDRPPAESRALDGEARLVKAPVTHVVKNRARQPFRNVVIEIVSEGTGKRAESQAYGQKAPGVRSELLFENPVVCGGTRGWNPARPSCATSTSSITWW